MSDSGDQLFLLQQNKHQIQFNLIEFPNLQFQDLPRIKDPYIDHQSQDTNIVLQLHREEEISKDESEESTRRVSLGESKDDDGEDGFKTPDSSDRKIPEVKQCPPAPRKPKAIKRKAPQGNVRRHLPLDPCEEVESLFPRSILVDFNRKIKKARSENLNSDD